MHNPDSYIHSADIVVPVNNTQAVGMDFVAADIAVQDFHKPDIHNYLVVVEMH